MSKLNQQLEGSLALLDKAATIERVDPTPMGVLQLAISQGADIDKLTKLMELQERWEANEARKAFNVAFSAFKSEAVTIAKNTDVKAGPLSGTKYANLFDVVNAVIPALSKHGLSHSWKLTKDEKEWMEVTCTIRHILGHSESVAMGASPDSGPGRNAIQARGSAKSYLERYTLLAATGTAASDTDTDGNSSSKVLDSEEFDRLYALLQFARTFDDAKKVFGEAYKAADSLKDEKSKKKFIDLYETKKKELR